MVDLNKAIELAPQYAKAYGDRGLVHLMRDENSDYLFQTKTKLSPGKEKTLTDSLASSTGGAGQSKLPSKHNKAFFNERVAILKLDYADGTFWQSLADVEGAKKTNSPD